MSVFAEHHKNRGTVEPVALTLDQIRVTVYPGELVWFVPPVTGGKVATRLISIDLESKTLELEVTATNRRIYRRGERLTGIPFGRVYKRSSVSKRYWPVARFSLQWLDFPTAKERAGKNGNDSHNW